MKRKRKTRGGVVTEQISRANILAMRIRNHLSLYDECHRKIRGILQYISNQTGWPYPPKEERDVFLQRYCEQLGINPHWSRSEKKPTNEFYLTKEWRALRYRAFEEYGRKCHCCRTTEGVMHVDHIKPRSTHPSLELEFSNLQILCEACNIGKSNRYETDWRGHEQVKH